MFKQFEIRIILVTCYDSQHKLTKVVYDVADSRVL